MQIHFKGHRGAITCVDFNPNGKQLGIIILSFLYKQFRRQWIHASWSGISNRKRVPIGFWVIQMPFFVCAFHRREN